MGAGDVWLPERMDLGASTLFFLGRAGMKAEPTWPTCSATSGQVDGANHLPQRVSTWSRCEADMRKCMRRIQQVATHARLSQ